MWLKEALSPVTINTGHLKRTKFFYHFMNGDVSYWTPKGYKVVYHLMSGDASHWTSKEYKIVYHFMSGDV